MNPEFILKLTILMSLFMFFMFIGSRFAFLYKHINELEKKQAKFQDLLDLIASSLPSNHVLKSLYHKLREIPLEKYPKDYEQMSLFIKGISEENFMKQRAILVNLIESTDNLLEKTRLKFKLEKYDELGNLMSLLSRDSSEEYKKILFENINLILKEINEVTDED